MAENIEFKLEVDLRPGGKEEIFNGAESFRQWLETERKFWNWGNVLKSPMDQNACSALNSSNGKLNSIQNVFSTIVNNVHNPGAFQQGVNSLKNTLRDYYKNNSILHSSNPRAKFIKLRNDMGSAQFFGKDPKEFCPQASELLASWDSYKVKSPIYPSWGKDQVAEIVEDCKK